METQTIKKITYQEFLNLFTEDDGDFIYELINGEVGKRNTLESKHQVVSANLHLIIGDYVMGHQLGKVLYAPIMVYLDEHNALQPDLLFVSVQCKEIIQKEGIAGVPEMIVEIISPSSIKIDRVDKRKIYQQSRVAEYWIVDPKHESVEVYEHTPGGYELFSFAVEHGLIQSKVITGLQIDVKTIFAA